ncbi:MAG: DUF302 domain-containing protein [Ekhidna sp.]
MSYYINKSVSKDFEETVQRAIDLLQREGFGVLTEINVEEVLKKKLDVSFPRYKILGACNPTFAYTALEKENKVGTMLPCNVIIREDGKTTVEVAAVDPLASMQAIENLELKDIAQEVKERLSRVIRDI